MNRAEKFIEKNKNRIKMSTIASCEFLAELLEQFHKEAMPTEAEIEAKFPCIPKMGPILEDNAYRGQGANWAKKFVREEGCKCKYCGKEIVFTDISKPSEVFCNSECLIKYDECYKCDQCGEPLKSQPIIIWDEHGKGLNFCSRDCVMEKCGKSRDPQCYFCGKVIDLKSGTYIEQVRVGTDGIEIHKYFCNEGCSGNSIHGCYTETLTLDELKEVHPDIIWVAHNTTNGLEGEIIVPEHTFNGGFYVGSLLSGYGYEIYLSTGGAVYCMYVNNGRMFEVNPLDGACPPGKYNLIKKDKTKEIRGNFIWQERFGSEKTGEYYTVMFVPDPNGKFIINDKP